MIFHGCPQVNPPTSPLSPARTSSNAVWRQALLVLRRGAAELGLELRQVVEEALDAWQGLAKSLVNQWLIND